MERTTTEGCQMWSLVMLCHSGFHFHNAQLYHILNSIRFLLAFPDLPAEPYDPGEHDSPLHEVEPSSSTSVMQLQPQIIEFKTTKQRMITATVKQLGSNILNRCDAGSLWTSGLLDTDKDGPKRHKLKQTDRAGVWSSWTLDAWRGSYCHCRQMNTINFGQGTSNLNLKIEKKGLK